MVLVVPENLVATPLLTLKLELTIAPSGKNRGSQIIRGDFVNTINAKLLAFLPWHMADVCIV